MANSFWANRDEGDSEWLLGWFARELEVITFWTAFGMLIAAGVLTGLGALIGKLFVVLVHLGSQPLDLTPGGSSGLLVLAMVVVAAAGIAAGVRVVRWSRATDRPADRLAGAFAILGVLMPVSAAYNVLSGALPDRIAVAVGDVVHAVLLAIPLWAIVRSIIKSRRERSA